MAGNKVAKHPVAPTLRGAFLKALDIKGKESGKTLPEIMYELIESEGMLAVMDRVAKFQERVSAVDHNVTGEVSLVDVLTNLGERDRRSTEVEERPDSVRH